MSPVADDKIVLALKSADTVSLKCVGVVTRIVYLTQLGYISHQVNRFATSFAKVTAFHTASQL